MIIRKKLFKITCTLIGKTKMFHYFSLFFSIFSLVIIGKSHYMLYNLVSAMQPRMLVTFDEQLRPLPTTVRVGQVSYLHFNQSHWKIVLKTKIEFELRCTNRLHICPAHKVILFRKLPCRKLLNIRQLFWVLHSLAAYNSIQIFPCIEGISPFFFYLLFSHILRGGKFSSWSANFYR